VSGTVLIVDDEASVRFTLRAILEAEGLEVVEAVDGEDGLAQIRDRLDLDLVISDLKMRRMDGLQLLAAVRELPAPPPFVLVTAHGSERTAVQAMKAGALDYFKKPYDADEIVRVVQRALSAGALATENRRLRARVALGRTMVFTSEAMMAVAEVVERVASRDVTVLIVGESGTGKELVARALVESSPRASRPFIKFNCAALPRELAEAELFGHRRGAFTGAANERRGLFRAAHGGTLLLDEIDALAPENQGALLRVLQEGEVKPLGQDDAESVDVRILASTTADLKRAEGFRPELFYRLNVVVIRMPPLRDRPEDIAPLARHFAHLYGERFGLGQVTVTPEFIAHLTAARWPGNVRELEHTIERSLALATEPTLDGNPFAQNERPAEAPSSLKERVEAFERDLLEQALREAGGNQSETARRLGLSRATLISKLEKLGLWGGA
jgi:two-component system response regulator HydG